jgi:hypothetical protein
MVLYRKNRKNSRRNRKNHRNTRRNNINMMGGEYSMPAPVGDDSLRGPSNMSLAQGQQFASLHANQHGGALSGGPYPGVVTEEALIPASMATAARTAPLNAALNEIKGMSDQAGGRRRRRRNTMRKNRKNRKNTRKNRRNNMSMRKGRKNRRNNNMSMRRRRNNMNMMGGAVLSPAATGAPGLLLPAGLEAKAVSGMNAEWKLAENPRAFAPGL